MPTATIATPAADAAQMIDGIWQFVHERFAFQAKQIKKVTGQCTAQSYDLMACCHGYSSWRGMKQVIDAIHYTDRWFDRPGVPRDANKECLWAAAIHRALSEQDVDFAYLDNGQFDGRRVERVLPKRSTGSPLLNEGIDDDIDRYMNGIGHKEELRECLFFQSLWLGNEPIYSNTAFHFIEDFWVRLAALWDGDDERAEIVTAAAFGDGNRFNAYWRNAGDERSLRQLDRQVEKALAGKASQLSPDLALAYRAARDEKVLPIAEWRRMLRNAHPGTLDGRIDRGPITVLSLANATEACWATLGLNPEEEPEDLDHPARWFSVWNLYAPTLESAVRCAATSPSIPRFSRLSEDEAQELGVPHLAGHYNITMF